MLLCCTPCQENWGGVLPLGQAQVLLYQVPLAPALAGRPLGQQQRSRGSECLGAACAFAGGACHRHVGGGRRVTRSGSDAPRGEWVALLHWLRLARHISAFLGICRVTGASGGREEQAACGVKGGGDYFLSCWRRSTTDVLACAVTMTCFLLGLLLLPPRGGALPPPSHSPSELLGKPRPATARAQCLLCSTGRRSSGPGPAPQS